MISVVISAYKGEYYIEEAIRSILLQLSFDDEIIVSDQKPGSATGKVVKRLADEDSRVILVDGKTGGVDNIVNALRYSKGNKIFICSQSDVWLPDKVKRVNELFEQGADLVLHNAYITDENLEIIHYSCFEKNKSRKGLVANVINNCYIGSCMAFDRKMLKFIMPIPKHIPLYDQWIGIISHIFGTVRLLDMPLIYHRQTEDSPADDKKQKKLHRRYLISKIYRRVFFKR